MSDLVPVLIWESYEDDAELEVEDGVVTNHDRLVNNGQTYAEVRALARDAAEQHDLTILTPDSTHWHDEFAELEAGDSWRLADLEG